jgi:hypothetical protein
MPILHKFHKTNWNNGFATHGAILDITPYEPEILFLGTYDPDIPGNETDFFYGRNFFWSGFKNLFIKNAVAITRRRGHTKPINPTLDEIFGLCKQLKLTFADLIPGVLHNNNPAFNLLPKNRVQVAEYNIRLIAEHNLSLINDNDFKQLDYMGQVNWNTKNIIDFLCKHPKIKTVYFTRRPTGIWQSHWNAIANHKCMEGRTLTNIFSPSGIGKPIFHSMTKLLNSWVHNTNPNFGQLENNWLTAHGVNSNNF